MNVGDVHMHPRFVLVAIVILATLAGSMVGLLGVTIAADDSRPGRSTVPDAATTPYRPDAEECSFVALINQFRADNGKGPLILLRSLGAAADHKSEDMASRNYFGHVEPPSEPGGVTTTFSENITNFGYTGS